MFVTLLENFFFIIAVSLLLFFQENKILLTCEIFKCAPFYHVYQRILPSLDLMNLSHRSFELTDRLLFKCLLTWFIGGRIDGLHLCKTEMKAYIYSRLKWSDSLNICFESTASFMILRFWDWFYPWLSKSSFFCSLIVLTTLFNI